MYRVARTVGGFGATVDYGVPGDVVTEYLSTPCQSFSECPDPYMCCSTSSGGFCMSQEDCKIYYDYCMGPGQGYPGCEGIHVAGGGPGTVPGGGDTGGGGTVPGGGDTGGGGTTPGGGGTVTEEQPSESLLDRLKRGDPLVVGVAAVGGLALVALVAKAAG